MAHMGYSQDPLFPPDNKFRYSYPAAVSRSNFQGNQGIIPADGRPCHGGSIQGDHIASRGIQGG